MHALLNTPPRCIHTPSLTPRRSWEIYSDHMTVHEQANIKRAGRAPTVRPLFKQGQTLGKNHTLPLLPQSPPPSLFRWLPKRSFPAYKPTGCPAEPTGYERDSSMLNLRASPEGASCHPQAATWFNNSPLQGHTMRSGQLLHASTTHERQRCRRWLRSLCLRSRPSCMRLCLSCVRLRHEGRCRSLVCGK